jgi:MurNAc alpha-1-phosphate uridylyltransferase
MDSLLLLMPTTRARGFSGSGDFMLDINGRAWRKASFIPRSHVWIGVQIIKPILYAEETQRIFSNNILWDKCEARNRLFGIIHHGTCFHAGTPQDLMEANRLLETGEGWAVA